MRRRVVPLAARLPALRPQAVPAAVPRTRSGERSRTNRVVPIVQIGTPVHDTAFDASLEEALRQGNVLAEAPAGP